MICIPIKKKSFSSTLKDFVEAQKTGDLTEIWFEEIKDLTTAKLAQLFKAKKNPIIYKSFADQEKLTEILNFPIDYLDLDIDTPKVLIKKLKKLSPKTKIIISYHNFTETPKDSKLKKITKKMLSSGADIVKIATMANSTIDSMRMLNFLSEISKEHPSIAICMGKDGKITRAAGHLFGNYLMYAPLKLTGKTASGQITAKELKDIINEQN